MVNRGSIYFLDGGYSSIYTGKYLHPRFTKSSLFMFVISLLGFKDRRLFIMTLPTLVQIVNMIGITCKSQRWAPANFRTISPTEHYENMPMQYTCTEIFFQV